VSKRGIYYDTETTGIDYKNERIIELAAYDCVTQKSFTKLINPGSPIPKEATAIHGITDEMCERAPSFKEVWEEFVLFCEGDVILIAHNGDAFDRPFLVEETKRAGCELPPWPSIDTLKWARKYRPDLPKHSLQFLRQIYGVTENRAHRALDDVLVLHEVFSTMIDDLPLEKVLELLGQAPSSTDDLMPFGKHRGKPIKELPKDYVEWLRKQEMLEKKENHGLKVALEKHFV